MKESDNVICSSVDRALVYIDLYAGSNFNAQSNSEFSVFFYRKKVNFIL